MPQTVSIRKRSVLSNAKHEVEASDMGETCPQTKAFAEPMHLKLKLWGHTGSGALTWRRTLSLHIQPQQKLGNTHTECTTRTRNIAM